MSELKTLLIVESSKKAKQIQNLLGDDFIVKPSVGHITELAKGGRHGLGVDIANDFKPHYVLSDDRISVLDDLMKAAKNCSNIIIASDPDREGESIAWHLSKRLEDMEKPIKRMVYHEITKPALLKSLKELRDVDLNIFHAQEARCILDRLVGFMASPFLMNFFGPKLSAGRVQSVVTRMVIEREAEIDAFIPKDFYTIQVSLGSDDKGEFLAKYSKKLTDEKVAKNMYQRLSDPNAEYIISEVKFDEEKRQAPPPLVTLSLQKIMNSEHDFDPERTMKAAQTLYETGYVSYIRTDSVRIEDESLNKVRDWLSENGLPVPKTKNLFKNKNESQDAHECIHPTDLNVVPNKNYEIINADEKLVYEIIWKNFIASQMMPAVYDTLKITAHVKNDNAAEVKASGKVLKSKGFLEILEFNDKNKIDIPSLKVGDVLSLYGKNPAKMEKKQTQPPPRYSLSKLMDELDKRNIGRPSTYADLLTKISTRNYVEKRGNVLHATELGKKITGVLSEYFTFMDYNYTSEMEESLDEIASGKINHVDMLKKFYPKFKLELDRAYLGHGGTLCSVCGSPMAMKIAKMSGAKFYGCSSFPKCKNVVNLIEPQPQEMQ